MRASIRLSKGGSFQFKRLVFWCGKQVVLNSNRPWQYVLLKSLCVAMNLIVLTLAHKRYCCIWVKKVWGINKKIFTYMTLWNCKKTHRVTIAANCNTLISKSADPRISLVKTPVKLETVGFLWTIIPDGMQPKAHWVEKSERQFGSSLCRGWIRAAKKCSSHRLMGRAVSGVKVTRLIRASQIEEF